MRLKKLTLFGFKSFPNRTKVEFNRGICAIVGPNGCGKSNVVDAIRWVLGEQSAKMLRARSMDEVIFSGSNGRKVSFAEVSLLLENKSGMAPPEFEHLPEIEIRRMVNRKGETRYLINGKTCRLKDIHYLLMDTGAGTRAYSIVDQGQVGQFVEMSPGDRRHIIEEVAGISRYKARRIEAERRMTDTTRNLERLYDLISEVDRQTRSASRQAKKTERYLELRKTEEELDKALLKYAWDEQIHGLAKLEKEMELATETLKGAEAALAAAKAEKEGINTELLQKDSEIKKLKAGLSVAEGRLEELRREMTGTEKQLYKAKVKLKTVENSASESEKRAESLLRRHSNVVKALETLRRDIDKLKAQEDEAKAQVHNAKVHVHQARKELEEVKVLLVDAAAEQARLDSERRALKERRKRLDIRIGKRREERQGLDDKLAALSEQQSRLNILVEELKNAYHELSQQRRDAEQELSDISEELSAVRKRYRDTRAERAAAAARLQALKEVEAAGEGIPVEVQQILQKEQGVLGLLADFIEVERGWERIFETALGPRLHALVVDNAETCQKIASSFKKRSSAILNMIIADPRCPYTTKAKDDSSFTPDKPIAPGQDIDSRGYDSLCHHVKAAPVILPALQSMLGGTVLSDSLHSSISKLAHAQADTNASGLSCRLPSMVTAQGECITPWLEVSVQGGGAERSGILVRKAMIKDLEQEVCALEQELQAVSNRKEALQTAESEKKGLVARLTSNAKKKQHKISRLEQEAEAIKLKVETARSRLELINFEIREAQEELREVEFSLEECETALGEAAQRNQGLSTQLKRREADLHRHEEFLEQKRQKHNELRIRLAEVESSIREREKEKQALERQQKRIRSDSESYVTERKKLLAAIGEQEKKLREVAAKVQAQEAAVANARKRTSILEQERDEILQKISSCEKMIDQREKTVRQAEKKVHGLEVDISESRQALQFIGQSSLERHCLSPAAITGVEHLTDTMDVDKIKTRLEDIRSKISRMGAVNLGALEEYEQLKERYEFLNAQKQDLEKSMADLKKAIDKINRTCRSRFKDALEAVNQSLDQVFPLLFDGGSARLQLESNDDILEAGVEYLVNLPGKKIQHLNLLSGGEKTMAAMALLFAVYFIKPSPFCLLDEVDAPLDEANTVRFNRLIKKIAKESQVVIITHNQRVMDTADTLYGVTMEDRGISKIVSVNLVSDHDQGNNEINHATA